MAIREAFGALTRSSQQTQTPFNFPVPLKGVNAVAAFSGLQRDEAHYLYNLLPTEQGLALRNGSVKVADTTHVIYNNLIPFAASDGEDYLFTVDSHLIQSIDPPSTESIIFESEVGNRFAGKGVYIQWTAANGDQYLHYADLKYGLIQFYDGSWSVPSITGIDLSKVRYVAIHKLRIWYLLEDDPNAYYLPIEAIQGAATKFNLGAKFKHGAASAGIFNLTHDAGDGVDDFFIAVSRSGDILVFQGTDPSSASTWELKGRYYIGEIPRGRKFGVEVLGDVFLLSSFGLTSVKQLLGGRESFQVHRDHPVDKVVNLIRTRMEEELNSVGWEVMVNPSIGSVIIQTPERRLHTDRDLHYVYNLNTKAWGFWRGVKSKSMAMLRGKMYFGGHSHVLWRMEGYDDYRVDNDDGTVSSEAIEFSILSSYSDAGHPGVFKRGGIVRPFFISDGAVEYDSAILYDYRFNELIAGQVGTVVNRSAWNSGLWEDAIWGGVRTLNSPEGTLGQGMGVVFAVAIKGKARGKTTLMEMPCTFQAGNVL